MPQCSKCGGRFLGQICDCGWSRLGTLQKSEEQKPVKEKKPKRKEQTDSTLKKQPFELHPFWQGAYRVIVVFAIMGMILKACGQID